MRRRQDSPDDRLTALPDGRVSLTLKTPWRDGTVCIVLTATQLVARLAALVPRPRQNLVRYHGVLAAHAEDRAAIVPGLSRHDRGATVALSSPPPE